MVVIAGFAWYTQEDMNYKKIITIEKGKRGGQPTIRGLRITVYDVLQKLASGMSAKAIIKDFPELTEEDIKATLQFAADREKKSFHA
jgi:uncharacterized protein (DUF433 family)